MSSELSVSPGAWHSHSLMHWLGSLSNRKHWLEPCSHLRLAGSKTWLAQTSLISAIKTSDGLPPTWALWMDFVITVCRLKACYRKPQRWVIRTVPCKIGSIKYQPHMRVKPRKGRRSKSGSRPNGYNCPLPLVSIQSFLVFWELEATALGIY